MTTTELLRILLRRWYLVLVGAVLSLGLLYTATHQQAVYWTQYNLLLLQPVGADHTNYLSNPKHALYPLAGVVVRDFNAGSNQPLLASPDTTLVGQGMRSGVQVRLPNQGSQWQPTFQANYLDVQVVDASPEAVLAQTEAVRVKVSQLLKARQEPANVVPGMQVTGIANTDDPVIYQVGGNRMRAAAAVAIAGAATTLFGVVLFDRWWLLRRRRRPAARPSSSEASSEVPTTTPAPNLVGSRA